MSILDSGFTLMLYGMGTVFFFLTTLIFLTTAMSRIVGRYFPEQNIAENRDVSNTRAMVDLGNSGIDPNLLKVLQSAVDKHRKKIK